MSGENSSRRFFGPMFGLVLLFAALGPAIGVALFFPLAVVLKPPAAADALALASLAFALLGHTMLLIAGYVVGAGPAAATGFLYALWDAAAPDRWPRAPVAAIIGGAVCYAVLLRLAALSGSVDMTFQASMDARTGEWIDAALSDGFQGALSHAFVACGAVAALVCATAASLVGLGMRPPAQSNAAGAA